MAHAPPHQHARSPPTGDAPHNAAPAGADGNQDEAAARNAFKLFDADGSGAIDAQELQSLAYSLGELLTPEETARMVKEIDQDGDNLIQFNEWFAWWKLPRTRRTAGPQKDVKLEGLRIKLLTKYAIHAVSNTVNTLRKSATEVPMDPATANEVVELCIRTTVGKIEAVKSSIRITSVVNQERLPPYLAVEFNMRPTHSPADIEALKAAAEGVINLDSIMLQMAAAGNPNAAVVPVAAPSSVRGVEIRDGRLRMSVALPTSDPKPMNTVNSNAMVPPGMNFEINASGNTDAHSTAADTRGFTIEMKLKLTRQAIGMVKVFAAMAGEKGKSIQDGLGLLEYLNRFSLEVDFKDFTEWLSRQTGKPAPDPATMAQMIREHLVPLVQPSDDPIQKTLVNFLKAAQQEGIVSGLASIHLGLGARTLTMDFTGMDVMFWVPPIP